MPKFFEFDPVREIPTHEVIATIEQRHKEVVRRSENFRHAQQLLARMRAEKNELRSEVETAQKRMQVERRLATSALQGEERQAAIAATRARSRAVSDARSRERRRAKWRAAGLSEAEVARREEKGRRIAETKAALRSATPE
jgi:hypothetical protein